LPGAATASDIVALMERGITHAKFFPAEAMGGVATLRAFAGPFPQMRFCPTGGITPDTAPDYLALPNVACVGGSWMTT
jgi:2-dehydro-3-deoxyphosphogluconate aldolase/(4S)-4-hydroxy-2-oxoglutarate aldolase